MEHQAPAGKQYQQAPWQHVVMAPEQKDRKLNLAAATHGGSLHCLVRERTPPPHVREHEPNLDHELQLPSCP